MEPKKIECPYKALCIAYQNLISTYRNLNALTEEVEDLKKQLAEKEKKEGKTPACSTARTC